MTTADRLAILAEPNPLLRRKGRDLTLKELQSKKINNLIQDMIQTMRNADGVGLAARQIGEDFNLAVIAMKDGELVLINPRITRYSILKEIAEEGCLSVPGVWGMVKRSKSVRVKALGLNGEPYTFKAKGFFARVVQHEVDHLNGILFIDKAKKIIKNK